MDPNNGGCQDEQNRQFFEEDPLRFTVDYPDLMGLLQEDQAEAGTVQPDPPLVISEVPVSGYGPDLPEFLDSTGINQGNQATAGTVQPDPPQVVSEVPVSAYGPFLSEFPNLTKVSESKFHRTCIGKEFQEFLRVREKSPSFVYQPLGIIPPMTQPHLGQPEGMNAGSQAAAGDQNRLARKREIDRAYRQRKKARIQELEVENQQLKAFEAEVGRLNHEIHENKHLMKSKLIELLHKNLALKGKILELQEDNHSVHRQLETQSMKLDQLLDKLELLDQLTGNEKAKETLKGIAKKLGALRTENKELMAAVKDKETLLQSLLSGLESIRNQLDQLLKEMLHDTGERGFCEISEC